jgi:putative ABC transport system permease protein
MVGIGLIVMVSILGASAKHSIGDTIDRAFTGDLIVQSGSPQQGGVPPALADEISRVPGVESAVPVRITQAELDGDATMMPGIEPVAAARLIDLRVQEGDPATIGDDGIAVSDTVADERGLRLGDGVTIRFADTGDQRFTVRARYANGDVTPLFITRSAYERNVATQLDYQVFVGLVDDVDVAAVRSEVRDAARRYPTAEVQDMTEFKAAQAAQVDQVLGLMQALLFLAIVIAVLGIANTLALSVVERTRELGLMRAVGMSRRQVRSTIRWESVIIALFGTALGLMVGLGFGVAVVRALGGQGIGTLAIPIPSLVVLTAVAAVAGVLAAWWPARRAARLDVLGAITTE